MNNVAPYFTFVGYPEKPTIALRLQFAELSLQ